MIIYKMKNIINKIKGNKKLEIGISVVLVIIVIAIFSIDGSGSSIFQKKLNIVETESSKIELVDYDHTNFTMKIPKGWLVSTAGDGMYFAIRVYDPNDDRYQIFAVLKADPLLKNYQAKKWFENYYNSFGGDGNKILAKAIVLPSATVESFYVNFNNYIDFVKEIGTTFAAPSLSNFRVIESFENNSAMKSVSTEDKVLRATFEDAITGAVGEGLFMGTLIDNGSYNYLGYDTMYYSMYNVIGISAGEYDLINYEKVLTESLNTLVYKESFINQTISDINQSTQNALAINKSINDAFDSYNQAWTNRQSSYDITSQKQSDATLSYERVYDTETGEIYKAYNGFLDSYTGNTIKPATDEMYTEPINGYIEK